MISGIKKKFIDILFETDSDEVKEQPVVDIRTEPEEVVSNFNAKDVLYKSKSSAFIDLEETIQEAQKEEEEKVDAPRDYEFSQQISPMFGVLKKSSDANKVIPPKPQKDEKMVSKPEDSHLDIVTSPFFGYGQNYEIRQMPDETVKEEGFTYDQDDPYVQGLYEHPGIPYDEDEEPVDEITLFDDIEDQ